MVSEEGVHTVYKQDSTESFTLRITSVYGVRGRNTLYVNRTVQNPLYLGLPVYMVSEEGKHTVYKQDSTVLFIFRITSVYGVRGRYTLYVNSIVQNPLYLGLPVYMVSEEGTHCM